ncbi:MAG: signal peptidase I [Gammaproteobacteria bacterium]|nr:signal peptidase I [Gammaproteobacteria bacterium]
MNFDFSALLVFLTFLTGAIWGLDVFIFAPKRREKATDSVRGSGHSAHQGDTSEWAKEPKIVEYAHSFFPVILIVLILRSFIVEPFRIPSNSMMPTLLTGDFILVNKFTYGIRLPVLNTKIIGVSEPERGDVAVFRYPKDPSVDYIKRIVGLPGDKISYKNKQLYINNVLIKQDFKGIYEGVGSGMMMTGANLITEHLDNADHDILVNSRRLMRDMNFEIPKGRYFVMGDNRDNSNDSRFWGTVPEANLVGKAFLIWMNWDSAGEGLAWNRVGSQIK